jgi:flagellin-specific chaperone FliS
MHANLKNDLDAVREVKKLMGEIRDAWSQVPDLIEGQSVVNFG